MKEYTSCFIGVPLPKVFQGEFEGLLADIRIIAPLFETVYSQTPHITGYYLDKQSQDNLPGISKVVRSRINILNGAAISVGGLGYFKEGDPRVIFLDVSYPEALRVFNQALTEDLANYYAPDNNLPFHPHLTVARLKTPQAQVLFMEARDKLNTRLSQVKWQFSVNEVCLYGVDSTKSPQYQEKLITLPV